MCCCTADQRQPFRQPREVELENVLVFVEVRLRRVRLFVCGTKQVALHLVRGLGVGVALEPLENLALDDVRAMLRQDAFAGLDVGLRQQQGADSDLFFVTSRQAGVRVAELCLLVRQVHAGLAELERRRTLILFAQSNVASQAAVVQSVARCQIGPHCWKCIR